MKARNPSTGNLETVYVKALDSFPVGVIVEYPTTDETKVPVGYMFCDGRAISRTEYSELFSLIGTRFGAGDGSTTFNIPSKEGLVTAGIKSSDTDFDTIGETLGTKTVTLTTQQMPSHSHKMPIGIAQWKNSGGSYGVSGSGTWSFNDNIVTSNTGGGQPHNNIQPTQVSNFIIKVKETRALAGNIVNSYSESQNSTYSCDYLNDCNTYSTSETFTGKYWIDGKPIYRKVLSGTLGTTGGNDISFPIDNLIDEGGYVRYGTAYQFPIPSTFGTQGVNDIRLIKKDANTLTLQYGSNLNSQNYAVWIEYTKK